MFCPDCKADRPTDNFTKDVRQRDGLSFYCAACARARQAASRRSRSGPPKHRGALRPSNVPEGMRWCPECGEVKTADGFPRNRAQRGGIGTYCKPCHNQIVRANRDKHGGSRTYHMRRRYGITAEHYDQMLAEQGASARSAAKHQLPTSITTTRPVASVACCASTATALSASSATPGRTTVGLTPRCVSSSR